MTNTKHNLTYGSDVELALYHLPTAQMIPATELNTPETSDNRGELKKNGVLQGTYHRDNILLEYQTLVCANLPGVFQSSKVIRNYLGLKYKNQLKVSLCPKALVEFTDPRMVTIPEAAELGCNPDYDAYTEQLAEPIHPAIMGLLRTGSGHIHIGNLPTLSFAQTCQFVRLLDIFVSVVHVVGYEAQVHFRGLARRNFYGQAGRFRLKEYGIEYRTPSAQSPHLTNPTMAKHIQIGIEKALCLTLRGVDSHEILSGSRVQDLINAPSVCELVLEEMEREPGRGVPVREFLKIQEAWGADLANARMAIGQYAAQHQNDV